MKLPLRLLPAAGLALAGCCDEAHVHAGGAEFLPTALVEEIPGGPTVLLVPQRSVPMFSCTVLVPAGSVLETNATNGAAHYLEHLLFNGTTSRTREEIYELADRLGAYHNASTQRERTVFQLLIPSENWREGLELQADMLLHSTLPPAMFEKEKGILLEELAKDRSDPSWDVERWIDGLRWGDDARALPVLGTEESIASMDRDSLVEFYRERYRREGLLLVLMGDFDPDEAVHRLVELYDAQEPGHAPDALPPPPAFPPGRTLHARSFPDLETVEVRILLPLVSGSTAERATAIVLASVLSSGERSAVSRAVDGVLSASAGLDGDASSSMLSLEVILPREADGAKAAEAILRHLARCVSEGFGPDEVRAAKRSLLVEQMFLREKIHYYGLMNAEILGRGGPHGPDRLLHETERVTAAQLDRLLGQAIRTDGRVLGFVAGPGVGAAQSALPAPPVKRARPRETSPVNEVPLAVPLAPASETRITMATLDDGLTLATHTSPEGRSFALHVLLRDRGLWEDYLGVPAGTADVLHRMFALGTADRTRDELRGHMTRNGIKMKVTDSDWIPYDDYYHSSEFSYVRVEAVDNCAGVAIDLLREVLTRPRLDAETFSTAQQAAAARADQDAASARAIARRVYYEALGPAHPLARGPAGTGDAIRALALDDVQRLHRAYCRPQNAIVTISANVHPASLQEALAPALLAPGDEVRPETMLSFTPAKIDGRVEVVHEAGREQSYLVVGASLASPESEAALRVAVALLSERLAERLREGEGLAYSIGASLRLARPGPEIHMIAGTRPENLERLEAGMREVAASLGLEPPTEDEITGAVNRGEGRSRMRRLTRIGQAYAMAMASFRHRDPTDLDGGHEALRAVTPDDVVQAARLHLSFDDSIVAIAR